MIIIFFTQNTQRFFNYLVTYYIFTNYLLRTCSNSSLLVLLTYKTEFLVRSFSPARHESFRTQHHFDSIPKPPNSSSRLSLISFTHFLRLRSPGLSLLSSSVCFSATVLGELLCNTILLLLSQLL